MADPGIPAPDTHSSGRITIDGPRNGRKRPQASNKGPLFQEPGFSVLKGINFYEKPTKSLANT